MPILVLVWVRSFIAPDFFENNEFDRSNVCDQSALEIGVRLRVAPF